MPTDRPSQLISFGDFRIDRRTLQLRCRGSERRLRAKSSAVLLYLAEHPNRLVTHAEILRTVWPDTTVSSTVLRVCIREIRVALGAEADRFLTTVPRRGYRFAREPGDSDAVRRIFVGRGPERAALHDALARARSGRRQVVFVTGEGGVGKTALLDHFLDEVRADGTMRGARGQSLELHGDAGGCAAVLELLSRLCDEADGSEVVRALTRWAPGWLLQLPGRIDEATANEIRGRSSNPSWEGRLLELREALERLASEKPLVLLLEDLQWSDPSTIDALAYLTRPTGPARILVVCTYRPGSLADGHPLIDTRRRLEARQRPTELQLGPLHLEEVDTYLAQRLGRHPPDDDVARAIHASTNGHPLHVVATVDRLLDQRRLALRDGRWSIERPLDDTGPETTTPRAGSLPDVPPSGERGLAAERRQLTVMCCDLASPADLAQRLDPEDLRSVVRAYQEMASKIIARHEGHVAQYLVDGLVVYFGYPRAREDDAARAVRAGLDLLTALHRLNDELEPEHGIRLASRVAVHTGPVVIGEMGSGEPLALGNVPHIADQVQGAADAGRVLVTSATRQLVASMFVMEDGGSHQVEGMPQPLRLHRVVRPGGVASRLSTKAGRLTPFVGRDVELATLVEHWEAAQQGAGRTILVYGEAGIGKSRLVHELGTRLEATARAWLASGATPYTAGTAFHPIIALAAQGLGFAGEDTTAARLAKVEHGLGHLATPETVSLMAALFGLPPATSLQFSPELRRQKTVELLAEWIGARDPAVMVVEDLHWCDPSSLELLGHLAARSPTARLLLLVTARPEFILPWDTGDHTVTIELERLAERETRDMVISLADEALPQSTVDALAARSDGVPLYVEELAKSIVEPQGPRGAEAIPATLADSLMGRLDRLESAKEVAQRAAVLGREFEYPLLAAVSDVSEADLRRGLQRLVDAGLVFARGEPPEASFAFKHALIQESAYQSLLKRTRQELHARIGQVLEERFPEYVSSQPELIARHYDQAGLIGKAVTHYEHAGKRAAERSANEEALLHLRRALALAETLPGTEERRQRELALLIATAAPLGSARGWSSPDYEATIVRAHELAAQIGSAPELPRVTEGMAAAFLMKGDVNTSLEVARQVLAAAEESGDTYDLLIAHVCLAMPLLFQGNFGPAMEHFEQAMALYDPTDEPAFEYMIGFDRGIAAHTYAALCSWYLGYPDRALALVEQAIAFARRMDHPMTLANILATSCTVLYERREFEAVQERTSEVIPLAEEFGFPFWASGALLFRGAGRVHSGDVEGGVADMQRASAELTRIGNGAAAPAGFVVLAEAFFKAGRHDEALGMIDMGEATAGLLAQHFADVEFLRLRAEILMDSDRAPLDEVEALFRKAMETARSQGAKIFELRSAVRLARLWEDRGELAAARDLLTPVYAALTEGADTPDMKSARALLTELDSGTTSAES